MFRRISYLSFGGGDKMRERNNVKIYHSPRVADPPEHGPDKSHLQITSIDGTNSPDEVVIISAHQDR